MFQPPDAPGHRLVDVEVVSEEDEVIQDALDIVEGAMRLYAGVIDVYDVEAERHLPRD